MSTDATSPTTEVKDATTTTQPVNASVEDKGKGKAKDSAAEDAMNEDDDDDDEEDDEDEEEEESDEEMEGDESMEAIDPSVIVGRRTRGVKVDYTSPEALAKAGLKQGEDGDDDDEDAKMKDD